MGDTPDQPGLKRGYVFQSDFRRDGDIEEHGYYARRRTIYAKIGEVTSLHEVIRAVVRFAPCTPVTWVENDAALSRVPHEGFACSGWTPKIEPGTYSFRSDDVKLENEYLGIDHEEPPRFPDTAGEVLASELRMVLASLREAERAQRHRKSSKSPVRDAGMLPRSMLSEVAVDLLRDCKDGQYPPGHELVCLIRELLNVDLANKDASREYTARELAINLVAAGYSGVRDLARVVRVSPSTVSQWLRDPSFNEAVAEAQAASERSLKHLSFPSTPHSNE
jgi:hypothetical protein